MDNKKKFRSVIHNDELNKIVDGMKLAVDAAYSTITSKGDYVLLLEPSGIVQTNDGYNIIKTLNTSCDFEYIGLQLVQKSCYDVAESIGDLTTATSGLIYELTKTVVDKMHAGVHYSTIERELDDINKAFEMFIDEHTMTDEKQIEEAIITTTKDEELGKIINKIYKEHGPNVHINIERTSHERNDNKYTVDIVDGLKIAVPKFDFECMHQKNDEVTVKDAKVVMVDTPVQGWNEKYWRPLAEFVAKNKQDLVLVCKTFGDDFYSVLSAINKDLQNICGKTIMPIEGMPEFFIETMTNMTGAKYNTSFMYQASIQGDITQMMGQIKSIDVIKTAQGTIMHLDFDDEFINHAKIDEEIKGWERILDDRSARLSEKDATNIRRTISVLKRKSVRLMINELDYLSFQRLSHQLEDGIVAGRRIRKDGVCYGSGFIGKHFAETMLNNFVEYKPAFTKQWDTIRSIALKHNEAYDITDYTKQLWDVSKEPMNTNIEGSHIYDSVAGHKFVLLQAINAAKYVSKISKIIKVEHIDEAQ